MILHFFKLQAFLLEKNPLLSKMFCEGALLFDKKEL